MSKSNLTNRMGFTLIETFVALAMISITALFSVELVRMVAEAIKLPRIQGEKVSLVKSIDQMINNKESCTKFFKGIQFVTADGGIEAPSLSIESLGLKAGETYGQHLRITELKIVQVGKVFPADSSNKDYLGRFYLKAEKVIKRTGDEAYSKYFPIHFQLNDEFKIEACGNKFYALAYCEAMRGTWDNSAGKCIFNKQASCETGRGNWDYNTNTCSHCAGLNGDYVYDPATKTAKCENLPAAPPADPIKALDGTDGVSVTYKWDTVSMAAVLTADWRCRDLSEGLYSNPDGTRSASDGSRWITCSEIQNKFCGPVNSTLKCVDSITHMGGVSATDVPQCNIKTAICVP